MTDTAANDFNVMLQKHGLYMPTYTGVIATGCYHPSAKSASQQFNSRSEHYARDNITSLQIAFANNFGAAEAGPGSSMTIRASIEYPRGTFTIVNWSGARDVVIPDGDDSPLSDPVEIVIPRGAFFSVRSFAQCAGGVVYKGFYANRVNGGAEAATSGLTDKTTCGTIPTGRHVVAPCLIVGKTDRPALGLIGDSVCAGAGDNIADVSGDIGILARPLGPHFAYINQAISSEPLGNFIGANGAKRRARTAWCSHIICEYGRNDFTSVSGSVFLGYVTTCAGLFPGKPFFQTTITPRTSSTDGWTTVGGQTVDGGHTSRLLVNHRLRAGGVPGVYDFFDLTKVVESDRDSGLWKAPGYTVDGTHPTTPAYYEVRDSGVLDPLRIRLAR